MRLYQLVTRSAEIFNPINIGAQCVCCAHFSPAWMVNASELSTPMPRGSIVNDDYTPVAEYFDRSRLYLIGA